MVQLPSLVTGTTIKTSVAPAPKKTHGMGLVTPEVKPTVPVTHATGIAKLTPTVSAARGHAISNADAAVMICRPDPQNTEPPRPAAPIVPYFEDGSGNIWHNIPGRLKVLVAKINPEGCNRKELLAMVAGLMSTVE